MMFGRYFTDAFEVDRTAAQWTPYPGFWDHDAKRVVQIAQTKPIKGRKLKSVTAVWGKAGKVLLVSRLWPITHKVLATGFDTKVIGNTWWAFDDVNLSQKQRKALLLWMNSTLGLLFYYGRRVITRSAWMQMKKPAWQSMPVLNVRNLNKSSWKRWRRRMTLCRRRPSCHSHSSTAIRRGSKSIRRSAKHCRSRLSPQSASFWFENQV